MTQFVKEIKKTFSQFKGALSDNKSHEEPTNESSTATLTAEQEEKFLRTFNKSENDVTGKIISSVSQQQKPSRVLYLNDSTTVRFMGLQEKEDAYAAIEELRNEQPIVVVLRNTDQATSRAILDIIYGACHYSNLIVEKVDSHMLLIDPTFKI